MTTTMGRVAVDSKAADRIAVTKVRRMESWERTVERQVRNFFGRQERAVLAKLTSKKSREKFYGTTVPERGRRPIQAKAIGADDIFDDAAWNAQLRADAEGWLQSVMDDFGADTADILGTSWDLADPRVAANLRAQVNRVVGANETTFRAIADELAEGQQAGETLDQLTKRVRSVFEDADRRRAKLIARTEVVSAANSASIEAAIQSGVVKTKTWFCFSAETAVCGDAVAVARRWESGHLIELRTARRLGDAAVDHGTLTVTPEHRVLTPRGWVRARDLVEGDDLFGDAIDVHEGDSPGGVQPDPDCQPPSIAEIFRAATEEGAARWTVCVLPDLDGQGRYSDVEVVAIDGQLRDRLKAAATERIADRLLAMSDVRLGELLALRSSADRLVGATAAPQLRRGLAASGHGLLAVNNPAHLAGVTVPSDLDAMGPQQSLDCCLRAPDFDSEGPHGCALDVTLHQVIGVREVQGGRHVYDLETRSGWLIANGIIAHNSVVDDRTREDHVAADGQTVPLDEPFDVGGEALEYPGDPSGSPENVIACRCTTIFSTGQA